MTHSLQPKKVTAKCPVAGFWYADLLQYKIIIFLQFVRRILRIP